MRLTNDRLVSFIKNYFLYKKGDNTLYGSIKSDQYVQGISGYKIDADGRAEFRDLYATGELHASTFVLDEFKIEGGTSVIIDGGVVLEDVVSASSFTLKLEDPVSGHPGTAPLTAGDVIRIKDWDSGVYDIWATVDSSTDNTTYYSYVITVVSGTTGSTIEAGVPVLFYKTGGGSIVLTAALDDNPYIDILSHNSTPYNAGGQVRHVRTGRLDGLDVYTTLGPDEFGIAAGPDLDSSLSTGKYFVASSDRFLMRNLDLEMHNGTSQTVSLLSSGELKLGTNVAASGTTQFHFDPSTGQLTIGATSGDYIQLSSGSITVVGDGSGVTSIDGGNIQTGTITATQLSSNSVTADKITAGSVTATKISVSSLSAISANMGTLTAGQAQFLSSGSLGVNATGLVIDATGLTYEAETWNLVGLNSEVLQVGIKASDGKLYAGGGTVVLDENGILVNGSPLSAIIDESYLVVYSSSDLPNDRRLIDGNGLSGVDGGPGGNYTMNVGEGNGIQVLSSTVAVDVDYAFSWTASHTHSANLQISADILMNSSFPSNFIGSSTFSSESSGWRIDNTGNADFRYIYADELHVQAFVAEIAQALVGEDYVTYSRAKLAEDFTIPATGNTGTIYFEDLEGFPDIAVATASATTRLTGDWIRLRHINMTSGGGLIVKDVWGRIYNYTNGTAGDGKQSWTWYTEDDGGVSTSVIHAGALALDYGQTGQGIIKLTVLDGPAGSGTNAPYMDIQTWVTDPSVSGNFTTQLRLGNLNGITDPVFPTIGGYGLYSESAYLKGEIQAASGTVILNSDGIIIDAGSSTVFSDVNSLSFDFGDRDLSYVYSYVSGTTKGMSIVVDGSFTGDDGEFNIRTEGGLGENANIFMYSDFSGETRIALNAEQVVIDSGNLDITSPSTLTATGNVYLDGAVLVEGFIQWNDQTATSGTGVYMDVQAVHDVTVTSSQELSLINLEMRNRDSVTANSWLYGIRVITEVDGTDNGAGINIGNFGRADGLYINNGGKAGAVSNNNPTAIGIDLNRDGVNPNIENSSTYTGYGIQIWDHSSTNVGVDGPHLILLRKINNPDSDHPMIEIEGNRRAIRLLQPGGVGYDGNAEMVGMYDSSGNQIWNIQAVGNQFFLADDIGIFWTYASSSDVGGIRQNGNYLDIHNAPTGFRIVDHTYTSVHFAFNDSTGNMDVGTGDIYFIDTTRNQGIFFDFGSSLYGAIVQDLTNDFLDIRGGPSALRILNNAGSSELMRIANDGTVGIGTTNTFAQFLISEDIGFNASGETYLRNRSTSWFTMSDIGGYTWLGWFAEYNGTNWLGTHATVDGMWIHGGNGSIRILSASNNGDGGTLTPSEQVRFGSDGNVSIGTSGSYEKLTVSGAIAIVDGMTAPGTDSGWAKIYVDSSDGDLKVKFGDGTVKTIVTDT